MWKRTLIDAGAFLVVVAIAHAVFDDLLMALIAGVIAFGGAEAAQRRGNEWRD